MESKVYTCYDSKTEIYMTPFMARNMGEALRSFQDAVNDPKTTISQHPEDYTLFEIASYDDSTGTYKPHHAKISMGVAIEFKKS